MQCVTKCCDNYSACEDMQVICIFMSLLCQLCYYKNVCLCIAFSLFFDIVFRSGLY